MKQITAIINGKPTLAVCGISVSELIGGEKPCGGHGKCGKCKVFAKGTLSALTDAERKHLTADELARGIRLACLTYALGECEIETLTERADTQIVTDGALPQIELNPEFSQYGVAIDIGTTTLAARLYDTKGKPLAETSCLNPQQEWGADVISRIEAALAGKAGELAGAIRKALDEILAELATKADIDTKAIDGVAITGNTVMLSLLTEEDVEPFSHAPFDAKRLFGETLTAKELELISLKPDTAVYLPPCISAFVGADTTCAILATELTKKTEPAMLADIGTNGEMALWSNEALTVCSTAAGPAFEGVGISMGMRGAVGAIDRVTVTDGSLHAHVIGDVEPKGICGSGLIDAVACMLDQEILDESGFLEDEPFTVQAPVTLTQKDIRMLQLAKSAISAGLLTLIQNEQLTPTDISALYIAGGFGNYLNMQSAGRIGLLLHELTDRTKTVGNAALSGAVMLLLDRRMRDDAQLLVKKSRVADLSANPIFINAYTEGMMFEG